MGKKGVKIGLGEFLGDQADKFTKQGHLPSGPRQHSEEEFGRRGGNRRREDREPSQSDQDFQWRGGRTSRPGNDSEPAWRGGASRGGYDRFSSRNESRGGQSYTPLKLQSRGGASSASVESNGNDKFSKAFGNSASGGRGPIDDVTAKVEAIKVQQENTKSKKQAAKEAAQKVREEKEMEKKKKAAEESAKKEEALKELAAFEKIESGVVDQLMNSGKRGEELTAYGKTLYKDAVVPRGAKLVSAILFTTESAKRNVDWTNMEEFGDILASIVYVSDPETEQLKTLYAIQRYFHSISFPKGLLEAVFTALYQNDIMDEDAFIAYKHDIEDDTPGKMKAIIQTTEWLTMLEATAMEDDEEEDEEEEDYVHEPINL